MPGMMGFNPYGGYGQPQSYMPQTAQMAAQQAYMQQMAAQMPPQNMPAQPGVAVRMVTSKEEATTAQIPFDSTINVFVNMGAGEIYIKRFNPNTGGAWFAEYVEAGKTKEPQETAKAPEYATVDMVSALDQRVSELAAAMHERRMRRAQADEQC